MPPIAGAKPGDDLKAESEVELEFIGDVNGPNGVVFGVKRNIPPRKTYFAKIGDTIGMRFTLTAQGTTKQGIRILIVRDATDDRLIILEERVKQGIKQGDSHLLRKC